jgi:hypothetical protein
MPPAARPPVRYIDRMSTLRPLALSAVLIACLFPGCSASAPAQPQPGPSQPAGATPALGSHAPQTEPVDIRGRVTQARRNSMSEPPVGTIQVEGKLEPGTRYEKAVIHVGHKTRVFLGRDGKAASFAFLHEGDLVEVTFEGPATEEDPVKATAAKIVILEHAP